MSFLRRLFGSRAATVEIAATMMVPDRDDAAVEVVGEGSYQDAIDRVAGGKTEDGARLAEHTALLWPEPNNRYDKNAIAVKVDGRTVGYLSRENAVLYRPVIAWADAHGKKIACEARITGGWQRGRGDSGNYGVVLHLGSPGECLLDMIGDETVVRVDHPWGGHLIAFTGDGRCQFRDVPLDRAVATKLARRAGMEVHPRVTKKVMLLVDCDPKTISGNERKAGEYGIPVIPEEQFWAALGLDVTVQGTSSR